jgi:hypothetical protein
VEFYLGTKWEISTINTGTGLKPTPAITAPTIIQPNINVGYVMNPGTGNPGTSTLYYDGTNWSLN